MNILNFYRVLHHIIAEVIRRTQDQARLDASTGHPNRETSWMMVASETFLFDLTLGICSASEFPAPDHQCVIE